MILVRGLNSNSVGLASLNLYGTRLPSTLIYFCIVVLCSPFAAHGDAGAGWPASAPPFDFARFKKLNADMAQLAADVDALTDFAFRNTVSGKRPDFISGSFTLGLREYWINGHKEQVMENSLAMGGRDESGTGSSREDHSPGEPRIPPFEFPQDIGKEKAGVQDNAEGPLVGAGDMGEREGSRWFWQRWLLYTIFAHEVWILLQHANILFNPLTQWMDREYGIDLLKKRMFWVIAMVLGAYWAREVLSMLLAIPFVSPLTLKMLLISSVYHMGKIALVMLDATRGWSPTLGVMRLLIDHWHISTVKDMLLSIKRITLQGFDLMTHLLIVRDMLRWDEESSVEHLGLRFTLMVVFIVWLAHAMVNQLTHRSTATLLVELAKKYVGGWRSYGDHGGDISRKKVGGDPTALEGGEAESMCSSSSSPGHQRCVVCHLLTRDQPPAAPVTKRAE